MLDLNSILTRRRKAIVAVTALLWVAAFALTHLPSSDLPNFRTGDASLHAIGFFGLTCWLMLSLASYPGSRFRRIGVALIVMAIYAALDEISQPLVGRTCDLRDWQNDMIGAIAAVAVCETAFLLWLRKS